MGDRPHVKMAQSSYVFPPHLAAGNRSPHGQLAVPGDAGLAPVHLHQPGLLAAAGRLGGELEQVVGVSQGLGYFHLQSTHWAGLHTLHLLHLTSDNWLCFVDSC